MKAVLILALFVIAYSHPTYYPEVNTNELCNQDEPAPIQSYHIHVLYMQNNPNQVKNVFALRDSFRKEFASEMGPDCHSLSHNPYNCFLDPDYEASGPFPTAEWAVFVLPGSLEKMTMWMM